MATRTPADGTASPSTAASPKGRPCVLSPAAPTTSTCSLRPPWRSEPTPYLRRGHRAAARCGRHPGAGLRVAPGRPCSSTPTGTTPSCGSPSRAPAARPPRSTPCAPHPRFSYLHHYLPEGLRGTGSDQPVPRALPRQPRRAPHRSRGPHRRRRPALRRPHDAEPLPRPRHWFNRVRLRPARGPSAPVLQHARGSCSPGVARPKACAWRCGSCSTTAPACLSPRLLANRSASGSPSASAPATRACRTRSRPTPATASSSTRPTHGPRRSAPTNSTGGSASTCAPVRRGLDARCECGPATVAERSRPGHGRGAACT